MTMLTRNIATLTAKIDAHRAADLLVQDIYYDGETGKACFIGCLAHGNNPTLIAEEYGLPEMVTRLIESIHERLPDDEMGEFFSAIPRAIGEDGKDLTRVPWLFLADVLRHLPKTTDEVQAVIDPVIAGMDMLASGEEWPVLASAAADAADAAAEAWAAWAARAAADAAWAAEAAARAAADAARRGAAGQGKVFKGENHEDDHGRNHRHVTAVDARIYRRRPDIYRRRPDIYRRRPDIYRRRPDIYRRRPDVGFVGHTGGQCGRRTRHSPR